MLDLKKQLEDRMYRAGSPMRNLMKDKMAQKAAISDFDATEAPAIEESLYKEDDLG